MVLTALTSLKKLTDKSSLSSFIVGELLSFYLQKLLKTIAKTHGNSGK